MWKAGFFYALFFRAGTGDDSRADGQSSRQFAVKEAVAKYLEPDFQDFVLEISRYCGMREANLM